MQKRFSFFLLVSTLIVSIFSCKNFMNGGDFLTQLEDNVWNVNHEQPVAKIVSPVYSPTGDHKNTSIIFSFSKAINAESFNDGFFVFDNEGNSIRDKYGEPVWNEEFTQVIIPVNKMNLLEIPEGSAINIKIVLSLAVKDTDGVSIAEPISEIFVINSTYDSEAPTFESLKISKSFNDINADENIFIEGSIEEGNEPVTEKTDNIINTNHIQRTLCLSLEAHDYDNTRIWAFIDYKRVYTNDDVAVNEETQTSDAVELTGHPENSANSTGNISFNISNEIGDGLLKVNLYLKDASNNISSPKTFYIVKDTQYDLSTESGLYTPMITPRMEGRPDDYTTNKIQLNVINDCNKSLGLIHYNIIEVADQNECRSDIHMIYRGKIYGTPLNKIKLTISCGKALNDFAYQNLPVPIIDNWKIDYPQQVYNYIYNNPKIDVCIVVTATDPVGNKNEKVIYIPKRRTFFSVEHDNTNTSKITINFDKKGGSDITNELGLNGQFTVTASDRIYYAEVPDNANVNTLELKRNFKYIENTNYETSFYDSSDTVFQYRYTTQKEQNNWNSKETTNLGSAGYDNDPYDSYPDPSTLYLPDSTKKYFVVLLEQYNFTKSGAWLGTTYGVPQTFFITTSTPDNPFSNSNISFTATKEKNLDKPGTYKINIDFDNTTLPENAEISYGWSLDNGSNWAYYSDPEKTKQFIVTTPLIPTSKNQVFNYDDEGNYSNEGDHDLSKKLPVNNYEIKPKLKIIAAYNGFFIESAPQEISFLRDEDNTPPFIDAWSGAHNLTLSADGTYFYVANTPIYDEAMNDPDSFIYYVAPYQPGWGENFNPLTEAQIKSLQGVTEPLYHNYWMDGSKPKNGNVFEFPVNGLPDGDYMYFATVTDKYNNSSTTGIGKAHIGTFKNKIIPEWNNGKIKAQLKLEASENFSNNMMYLQYFDNNKWLHYEIENTDGSTSSPCDNKWNGAMTYRSAVTIQKNGNTLMFESDSSSNHILAPETENGNTFKNSLGGILQTGKFYKLVITAYNMGGTNFKIKPDGGYEFKDYNGSYDVFQDETVSYPAYMYVPGTGDDLTNVTHTFDSVSGRLMSNKPVLINVISSLYDLGENVDEWERRGKTIYSEISSPPSNVIPFDYSAAQTKMFNSTEKGKRYYVVTYHFVDNEAAISRVFRTF